MRRFLLTMGVALVALSVLALAQPAPNNCDSKNGPCTVRTLAVRGDAGVAGTFSAAIVDAGTVYAGTLVAANVDAGVLKEADRNLLGQASGQTKMIACVGSKTLAAGVATVTFANVNCEEFGAAPYCVCTNASNTTENACSATNATTTTIDLNGDTTDTYNFLCIGEP